MLKQTAFLCSVITMVAGVCGITQAGLIENVTATASSSFSDVAGLPQLAVNGAGMNEDRTLHNSDHDQVPGDVDVWQTHWIGADNDVSNAWFKVDLGQSYDLSKLLVWNCNDYYENSYLYRCIAQADVYVSNSAAPGAIPTDNASNSDWTLVVADIAFNQAQALSAQPYTDSIRLAGLSGQFVAIKVDAIGGTDFFGNNIVSLAEVQVFSVPEPNAIVLTLGALIGLVCYAWRKR